MGNLGDRAYFDACVYTSAEGREQLRIAALVVAKAVLGYDLDASRRSLALQYQNLLESRPGALDLCNQVRTIWGVGSESRTAGTSGVVAPMKQLETVAENVYKGRGGGGFPWGWAAIGLLTIGGGIYAYRKYYRGGSSRAVSGARCRGCLARA